MHKDTEKELKDWLIEPYPGCWKVHKIVERINKNFTDNRILEEKLKKEVGHGNYNCGNYECCGKNTKEKKRLNKNKKMYSQNSKHKNSAKHNSLQQRAKMLTISFSKTNTPPSTHSQEA